MKSSASPSSETLLLFANESERSSHSCRPLQRGFEGHRHKISKLGQETLKDIQAKETDAKGALEQLYFATKHSKTLRGQTQQECETSPQPLGGFKKSQFILLKFPDSRVTAGRSSSSEKVSQKLDTDTGLRFTGCVGTELGGQQAMGSTHMGSRRAPGMFPTWLLGSRPQIW